LSHAEAPADFEAEGEEVEMESCWAARAELLDAIYSGDLQNPIMIAGLLALETARISGRLDELRPADAPWPARAVVAAPPSSALPSRCSPTARSTSNLSALPLSQ
jgi:ADP-ribose pyrophosphatase